MVVVPAGSFLMGSPLDEENRRKREGPVHRVTIPKSFAVGKYEVTKGEFAAFARDTGHAAQGRLPLLGHRRRQLQGRRRPHLAESRVRQFWVEWGVAPEGQPPSRKETHHD